MKIRYISHCYKRQKIRSGAHWQHKSQSTRQAPSDSSQHSAPHALSLNVFIYLSFSLNSKWRAHNRRHSILLHLDPIATETSSVVSALGTPRYNVPDRLGNQSILLDLCRFGILVIVDGILSSEVKTWMISPLPLRTTVLSK